MTVCNNERVAADGYLEKRNDLWRLWPLNKCLKLFLSPFLKLLGYI